MHQCLCVLEVSRTMADCLRSPDALSRAKTCKALLDPGRDRVWRHVNSFEPLIFPVSQESFSPKKN